MPRVTTTGLQSTIPSVSAIPQGWGIASGTVDAIEVAYTPANTVLIDGMCLGGRASGTNTSATPTFNPDQLGAYTIKKTVNGAWVALGAGDIPLEPIFRWNASLTIWELVNPADRVAPWAAAGGTVDAIVATFSPTTLAGDLVDGFVQKVRASGANVTTAPTYSPDTLPAHTIKKLGGQPLVAGDIWGANHELILVYHLSDTHWELVNPATGKPEDATYGSLYSALVADGAAGSNVATAQAWFATNSTFTVKAGTYEFRGKLYLSRAAGVTSHTTGTLFGGTATVTSISGVAKANDTDDTGTTLLAFKSLWFAAATATVVKTASTSATEQIVIEIEGTVTFAGVGTFIPQYIFSVAPGGAGTPKKGSYFSMRFINANPQGAVA